MCGIIEVISLNNRFLNPNSISTLNPLQKHRGPDDEGYFLFEVVICLTT
jgi:asparagine synthetase B (glutamine-hydrolysing)